jgi:hypothetical protein
MMALVILGVGVLAFVEAQQSFADSNSWSTQAATATFLANEVREMTRRLPRHDPVTGLYITNGQLIGWGLESGEVTAQDLDDLDDLDDLRFGLDGDLPGPIDAFGDIIPAVDDQGNVLHDEDGNLIPMRGWSQTVTVEKLDPEDNGAAVDHEATQPPGEGSPGRTVEQFPVRVTVVVEYQGPYDARPREMTRVMWIVPP